MSEVRENENTPEMPRQRIIVTVTGRKGGVGKTTTSVQLATYFAALGPTVLIDGDPNQSSFDWAREGKLPFQTISREEAAMHKDEPFVVIDTEAGTEEHQLKALARGSHLLVLPTSPGRLSMKVLADTIGALKRAGVTNYKVLLTAVPTRRQAAADKARASLEKAGVPVFATYIPDLAVFETAVIQGVAVRDVLGGGEYAARAWAAYEAVGREIMG